MNPKKNSAPAPVAIVYMCAGISSRFGGKIKQFAIVGTKGETLIEVSIKQALKAGFNEIVFIVGEKTELPFREKFGDSYQGTPIKYAKQSFDPALRDRPWGTTDAIVAASKVINGSFAICNGDDLYGENSFRIVHDFISGNSSECAVVGYELGKVIPEEGKTNRATFSLDKAGFVVGITEVYNIEKNSLSKMGLSESTPVSMNLFGISKSTLSLLENNLKEFKKSRPNDRTSECLLPNELGKLSLKGKIRIHLLRSPDRWLGVTNPGDEITVRNALLRGVQ